LKVHVVDMLTQRLRSSSWPYPIRTCSHTLPNSPSSNHWKDGGSRKDIDVTYRWNPVNARSVKVEDVKVWGGCDGTKLGSYTVSTAPQFTRYM
jgi:hypothetical protein